MSRWTLDDPIAFAHESWSALAADDDHRVTRYAPAERAAYDAARLAAGVEDAPFGHPLTALDEAADALFCGCHAAGVEFGVIAERTRREFLAAADGPRIPWLAKPAAAAEEG
jgi:hypothetical protein